ncbi:WGR domain-containing protein [Rhizobium sp. G187]|uniref:WGR domain-containing protein n=1 Tax=Rhizobium sp. G187 TaxID=3451352 RepID=UPI003EE45E7D
MNAEPDHQIYIERIDPAKNMARFYAMEISTSLFGGICLTRIWGRIGRRGQTKMHLFEQEAEAVDLFRDLIRRKHARGYRPPVR